MARLAIKSGDFREVLKKYKRELNAEFDYDNVGPLLVKRGLVKKGEYDTFGELIAAECKKSSNWPIHKWFQVFETIQKISKYEARASSIINELKQTKSLYEYPVQVDGCASEEESTQVDSCSCSWDFVKVLMSVLTNEQYDTEEQASEQMDNYWTESKTKPDSCLPPWVDGEELETNALKYWERSRKYTLKQLGKFIEIIAYCWTKVTEIFGEEDIKKKIGKAIIKLKELIGKLETQTSPDDIKATEETLISHMKYIESIIDDATSPTSCLQYIKNTMRYDLIDVKKLKIISSFVPIINHVIKMLESPNPSKLFSDLKKLWQKNVDPLIKAKDLYGDIDSLRKTARTRGRVMSFVYGLTAGVVVLLGGPTIAIVAGVGVAGIGVAYTEYYVYTLPGFVESCKKEFDKFGEALFEIPDK